MIIQVLISTMNQQDIKKLIKEVNTKSAVVVNQVTENIIVPKDIRTSLVTAISIKERGLSKSRNRAIKAATAEVCLIADDDMYYVDSYENIVTEAYVRYPDADIITFYVDHEDPNRATKRQKEGRLSLLQTMKTSSCQISFRRSSILSKDLTMDETFGTGTDKYMGEESIFLFDCHKKGLKVYHVHDRIAVLKKENESTWFEGYNKKYFIVKGAVFYRMSKLLCPFLIIQFSIRKKHLFNDVSLLKSIRLMASGAYNEAQL